MKKLAIVALVLFGLICIFIGFMIGEYWSLRYALTIAEHFMTVQIDEAEIAKALLQYKNEIRGCLF